LAENGSGNLESIYRRIEENETNLKALKQELLQVKSDLKYDREGVRQYFLDAAKAADISNLDSLKQLTEKHVERIILRSTGDISIDFIFQPAPASAYIVGAEGAEFYYPHQFSLVSISTGF
jgi:hypothetical protein